MNDNKDPKSKQSLHEKLVDTYRQAVGGMVIGVCLMGSFLAAPADNGSAVHSPVTTQPVLAVR